MAIPLHYKINLHLWTLNQGEISSTIANYITTSQPKCFVIENVKNFVKKHKAGCVVDFSVPKMSPMSLFKNHFSFNHNLDLI